MRLIEEIGPIIVDAKLAKEEGVPRIIMPEDSPLTERLTCGKCGIGFYWPPLPSYPKPRRKDLCTTCDRLTEGDAYEPFDPCTVEDMLEISS